MLNLMLLILAAWVMLAFATAALFSRVQALGRRQARLTRSGARIAAPAAYGTDVTTVWR